MAVILEHQFVGKRDRMEELPLWEERLWVRGAWLWRASRDPPTGTFNSESCSGGHQQGAGPSVSSPVRAAGPSPPSRRSLGATSFPLAAADSPGAGIHDRAPLGIGPAVNRRSVCDRRRFVRGSGCAQGGPLRVPCSYWLGAVSLGTWRRRQPGLLPAVLGATGNG